MGEPVSIEWFGACRDCGDFYAFANARTSVSRDEVPHLRSKAPSRREHDSMAFLDAAHVAITNFRAAGPDGNRWLHHAPLAARLGVEMLR